MVDFDIMSPGFTGLGMAIFMKAVEDGCNAEWLMELADFYEVNIPKRALARQPASKLRYCTKKDMLLAIDDRSEKQKLRLSLEDGISPFAPMFS